MVAPRKPQIPVEQLTGDMRAGGLSDELRALAAKRMGSYERAAAWLPDQDALVRQFVAALRPLAGLPFRAVLEHALALGLAEDAFPDLAELIAPPRPAPELVTAVAVASARRLADIASIALEEANDMLATFDPARREE